MSLCLNEISRLVTVSAQGCTSEERWVGVSFFTNGGYQGTRSRDRIRMSTMRSRGAHDSLRFRFGARFLHPPATPDLRPALG